MVRSHRVSRVSQVLHEFPLAGSQAQCSESVFEADDISVQHFHAVWCGSSGVSTQVLGVVLLGKVMRLVMICCCCDGVEETELPDRSIIHVLYVSLLATCSPSLARLRPLQLCYVLIS